jgi:phosphonoacetaldehyde hydrolase
MKAIRAVMFDWAGTVIDHGSRAPIVALLEALAAYGVQIDEATARGPMGRSKRDHIAQLFALADVKAQWQAAHQREATEADIDRIYERFVPRQCEVALLHTDLIDGVPELMRWLGEHDIRVGSTTGYPASVMEKLVPLAREKGFAPEAVVCASDVPAGRPAPWLLWECAKRMNVYPASACVAVDDTPVGIEAARNAGMWAIGVTASGNEVGLSVDAWNDLLVSEKQDRIDVASARLRDAGAHAVVYSVKELAQILSCLDEWIVSGKSSGSFAQS